MTEDEEKITTQDCGVYHKQGLAGGRLSSSVVIAF